MTDLDFARYQDPLTIQRVLHTARTIAIVGLSGNELRASYFVGYYLKRHGYRVIPVNPRETRSSARRATRACRRCRCRWTSSTCSVHRARCRGSRARRWRSVPAPVVPVRRDQRGGRADSRGRRRDGDHGSLPQGRACPLRGPDALARLQHGAHHRYAEGCSSCRGDATSRHRGSAAPANPAPTVKNSSSPASAEKPPRTQSSSA